MDGGWTVIRRWSEGACGGDSSSGSCHHNSNHHRPDRPTRELLVARADPIRLPHDHQITLFQVALEQIVHMPRRESETGPWRGNNPPHAHLTVEEAAVKCSCKSLGGGLCDARGRGDDGPQTDWARTFFSFFAPRKRPPEVISFSFSRSM